MSNVTILVEVNVYALIIGVVLRIIAVSIFIWTVVIPMIHEATIEGELRLFRVLLLVLGLMFVVTSVPTIIYSACRVIPCGTDLPFINQSAIINAMSYVVSTIAWIMIYNRKHN